MKENFVPVEYKENRLEENTILNTGSFSFYGNKHLFTYTVIVSVNKSFWTSRNWCFKYRTLVLVRWFVLHCSTNHLYLWWLSNSHCFCVLTFVANWSYIILFLQEKHSTPGFERNLKIRCGYILYLESSFVE